MTVVWRDSFERYTTLGKKYETVFGSGAPTLPIISTAAVRTGAQGLRLQRQWAAVRKNLGAQLATCAFGFGIRINGNTLQQPLVRLYDAGTLQITVDLLPDNTLRIYRGGTAVGTPSVAVIPSGSYRSLQGKVVFHDTTGSVVLKIDGVIISAGMGLSGVDTKNTANAYCTQIQLGNEANTNEDRSIDIDDFWVDDTDFLGDVRYECLVPNAAGDTTQFAIAGSPPAATNWESVDDPDPDGELTRVTSGTVSQEDLYNMTPLSIGSGTIVDVASLLYGRKTDAGARTARTVIKGGVGAGAPTTRGESGDVALGTTFAYAPGQSHLINPATSAAFTVTEINNAQLGHKVQT